MDCAIADVEVYVDDDNNKAYENERRFWMTDVIFEQSMSFKKQAAGKNCIPSKSPQMQYKIQFVGV